MSRAKSISAARSARSKRPIEVKSSKSREQQSQESDIIALGTGLITRKTIEVPEDYFYMVKQRALVRRIREKELWAEILKEYFTTHPNG